MRNQPLCPVPRVRLAARISGKQAAQASRRALFARLAPVWRGTKDSLRRAVREFLKPHRRQFGFLLRLARDARFAGLVAGAMLGASFLRAEAIELSDIAAGTGGFVINGIDAGDWSGRRVSSAGDVNGDGLADVIVGAHLAAPGGDTFAGESYVVFGKPDGGPVELSAVAAGAGGFVINGIDAFDGSGLGVSSAGDVNGDGLADVIIGGSGADAGGDLEAGESYVVFGKANGAPVELSAVALGFGGFVINGIDPVDQSGFGLSDAGDVNGDGLADLIVGASTADPDGDDIAGESYVVFGKADGAPVELSAVTAGAGGFVINGIDAEDRSGRTVSSAGDVNGDGLADLVVGAPYGDPSGENLAGESYVIFGKADGTPVELSAVALGFGGFGINGSDAGDYSGYSVSSAGDVNGDGLSDVIVGAFRADPDGDSRAGESYVVFGKADGAAVELSDVATGAGGFVINGIDASDYSGFSVSSAGDVNGDGHADLIVGASEAGPGGAADAGQSYVILGKADGAPIELSAVLLGFGGFGLNGIDEKDYSGGSVSSAGDVNGDGLADVIIGAFQADPGGNSQAGESYVIFSPEAAATSGTYRMTTLAGDGAGGFVAPLTDFGDVARVKIDFSDDDAASGGGLNGASNETVTITRAGGSISNLEGHADVLWEIESDRTGFASAEVTLKYLPSEVAALGDESGLTIYRAPAPSGPWTPLATTRLPERNEVKAAVTGFSFFTIVGQPNAAGGWETYE